MVPLGHRDTLAFAPFPEPDPTELVEATIEMGVQIDGKPRARIAVPADAREADVEAAARAEPRVAALLDGRPVRRVVVVPGRLVNFVLG